MVLSLEKRNSNENGSVRGLVHSNLAVWWGEGKYSGTIDKSVSIARVSSPHLLRDIGGSGERETGEARPPVRGARRVWARLTRCLYRGMYNNRLRRWHRYPFVSVGGHLGFPSAAYWHEGGPREVDTTMVSENDRETERIVWGRWGNRGR